MDDNLITTTVNDNEATMFITREVKENEAIILQLEFEKLKSNEKIDIFYIDFCQQNRISSIAIGKILNIHNYLNQKNKKLILKNMGKFLKNMFIEIQLDKIIQMDM